MNLQSINTTDESIDNYEILKRFAAIGFGTLLLVAGWMALVSLVKPFFEVNELVIHVLVDILPPVMFSCFTFLLIVLRKQYTLLQDARTLVHTELPVLLQQHVNETLAGEAKDLLKDTIVQQVMNDAVRGAQGLPRYHEVAIKFLSTMHEADSSLGPAIDILGRAHVSQLHQQLSDLQHDALSFAIGGKEQVDISLAMSENCRKSITFFDPTVYTDIDVNWSHAFKAFVERLKLSKLQKKQYILWPKNANVQTPVGDRNFSAFKSKMQKLGFEVYWVKEAALLEAGSNQNFTWRFELYDDQAVVKVQKKTIYNEADTIEITVRTVEQDHALKKAVGLLLQYGEKIT